MGKIIGLGQAHIPKVMPNLELSQYVDTNDEWIRTRTGIEQRYISEKTTTALAIEAAQQAVADSGISPDQIGLIIVATISADQMMPSTAASVQGAIGATQAMTFDLNAACTGFIVALNTAQQFLANGTYEYALVIGAEHLSSVIDWQDRNTCVLFGDGSAAVIIEKSQLFLAGEAFTKSDEAGVLTLGAKGTNPYIQMNGKEVFKFATSVLTSCIERAVAKAQISVETIDWIVPHQANRRIIEYVSRKQKIPMEKFIINLNQYGNTSSASIPLALVGAKQQFKTGDKILLIGFGGGLTWGYSLIEWSE
ncbi:MAG: beta-ketoacyl-ACP synthase III [Culicoidibacterales bacterium]